MCIRDSPEYVKVQRVLRKQYGFDPDTGEHVIMLMIEKGMLPNTPLGIKMQSFVNKLEKHAMTAEEKKLRSRK